MSATEPAARLHREAANFKVVDSVGHVLQRAGMYVGNVSAVSAEHPTLAENNGVTAVETVVTAEGLIRIFLEILSNAVDNILVTRRFAEDNPERRALATCRGALVAVTALPGAVTIWGTGAALNVEPHAGMSDADGYKSIPQVVFGTMYSGSNYGDEEKEERVGAGLNGLGCKLTNIFSSAFTVEVKDTVRGQLFSGKWRDNMQLVEATVTPGYVYLDGAWVSAGDPAATRGKKKLHTTGHSSVSVTFAPDWPRFPGCGDGFSPEVIRLFRRYAFDASFTAKVPIAFNSGEPVAPPPLDARSVTAMVRAHFPAAANPDRVVSHIEWATAADAAADVGKGRTALADAVASGKVRLPRVEIIVVDTPDAGRTLGFVNGLYVPAGAHVAEASARVAAAVIAAAPGLPKTAAVTPAAVLAHVSIIVNCHLPNPDFSGQMKGILTRPKPKIAIPPAAFHAAMTSKTARWGVVDKLAAAAADKEKKTAAKTDGKKQKRVSGVDGALDANLAGTARSRDCDLWLAEGDSAANYIAGRVDSLSGGRDTNGVYALRGKLINAMAASTAALIANAEYIGLKTLIGLKEGAVYAPPFSDLRYGRVCIAADSDDDGSSIRALIINCFAHKWPSLVAGGYIAYLATPAIRVTRRATGEIVHRFISDSAYDAWARGQAPAALAPLHVRHLKGLASSSNEDILDDLNTAPTINIVFDDGAPESLSLAFSPKRADDRKAWIQTWRDTGAGGGSAGAFAVDAGGATGAVDAGGAAAAPTKKRQRAGAAVVTAPPTGARTVSDIVNGDLAEYSFATLARAIASAKDGLKRSQRQALWHSLRFFKFEGPVGGMPSLKVSRLAAAVAEATSYAHGEVSMQGAIVGMAQSFVGTNNIPCLFPHGQFGSRAEGPSEYGAARYIATKLNWAVPLIFSEETLAVVPRRRVENLDAEAEWIPCDIPLVAVNGARGIATAWSSFVPNHRPSSVVAWVIRRLESKEAAAALPPLEPWYAGFTGELVVAASSDERRSFIARGAWKTLKLHDDGTVDLEITELPVGGLWTNAYRRWLEKLSEKDVLRDFDDKSTSEMPRFIVRRVNAKKLAAETSRAAAGAEIDAAALRLVTTTSLNNMVLLDGSGTPRRHAFIESAMEEHFSAMLPVYREVRERRVAAASAAVADATARHALLDAIASEAVGVFGRDTAAIEAALTLKGLDVALFRKLHLHEATKDKVAAAAAAITAAEERLRVARSETAESIWGLRLEALSAELAKRGL